MHPLANLLNDSAFTPPILRRRIAAGRPQKTLKCHLMNKIELIFKENLGINSRKTGQEAQLGTCGSPDGAASSGNIGQSPLLPRAVAVVLRDCTARRCLHGGVPYFTTSPPTGVPRRR